MKKKRTITILLSVVCCNVVFSIQKISIEILWIFCVYYRNKLVEVNKL